jgi:hypothetical protein
MLVLLCRISYKKMKILNQNYAMLFNSFALLCYCMKRSPMEVPSQKCLYFAYHLKNETFALLESYLFVLDRDPTIWKTGSGTLLLLIMTTVVQDLL